MESELVSLKELKIEPTEKSSSLAYKHWSKIFTKFLLQAEDKHTLDTPNYKFNKLKYLKKYLSPNVLNYISEVQTYEEAKEVLDGCYLKSKTLRFAEILLERRLKHPDESFCEYAHVLDELSDIIETSEQ